MLANTHIYAYTRTRVRKNPFLHTYTHAHTHTLALAYVHTPAYVVDPGALSLPLSLSFESRIVSEGELHGGDPNGTDTSR